MELVKQNAHYDVIVIGAGPAGLMASLSAGMHGANTLLLEKGSKLGRKLAISGGGRCNVTNRMSQEDLIRHIPGNGRFMYSPFSIFNNEDIIRFFEDMGIALKEEDRGRMFPVSDKAQTVVKALIKRVEDVGVTIRNNTEVDLVVYENNEVKGVRLKNKETIQASNVIIATGGKSVPHTGSTGDGYMWAKQAGHTITDLFPTEVPITSDEPFIQQKLLQGLSLRDVLLTVVDTKGKKLVSHDGDMIFTHFGLSGPAILRCSQFVVKALKKENVDHAFIHIDLFPSQSLVQVAETFRSMLDQQPKKALKNVLKGWIPERLLPMMSQKLNIDTEVSAKQLSNVNIEAIATLCKGFPVRVNGTLSIEEAFITGGGIHLKEIVPKTMESKLTSGLFFCGEVLDIHGYTGGYNITCAFSTGYTAGKSAAEKLWT